MQDKGTLGSKIAGVIAIFLILVCAFYLSFTWVTSKYEDQAEKIAAQYQDKDSARIAQKQYLDSIGKEKVWLGYTFNEARKLAIGKGLDLKGGMNVTLQVSVPELIRSMAANDSDPVFEQAMANADSVAKATRSDKYVQIFLNEYNKLDPNADYSVVFDGIVGRNEKNVQGVLEQEVSERVSSSTNVLRNRIDQFGVVSPNIQQLEKEGQILLELPGVKDHEQMRKMLKTSAKLEFYETQPVPYAAITMIDQALSQDTTYTGPMLSQLLGQSPGGILAGYVPSANRPATDAILSSKTAIDILKPANAKLAWSVKPTEVKDTVSGRTVDYWMLYSLKTTSDYKPALGGDVVSAARSDFDPNKPSESVVSMTMTSDAARKWADITGSNIGKPVAIVLDDQVYSAPNVNDKIEGGSSQITGKFTPEEAKDLAIVLKSGKMAAQIDIISDTVIGPSLGQQAIESGFMSFIVALVLLMIFMMAFYGVIPGLIANLGLVFNIFFTFGILASFQAVLTLSGIAGIVLALGMAVDANVLIFERAKEELRAGKNIRTAIADGYSNAFSAIFDSNLTSIITGVILLLFGSGPIKGFATTLIIGIVCSFFTAVYLTRLVFIAFGKTKPFMNLTFTTPLSRRMFTDTHFNFLGARKISLIVCCALSAVIIVSLCTKKLSPGIDFSGGRNYVVQFDHDVDTEHLKDLLTPAFEGNTPAVITIDDNSKVRISTNYKIDSSDEGIDEEITDMLYAALQPELNGMSLEDFSTTNENMGVMSSQKVGPTIAKEMATEAVIAVLLSLVAMFLYILARFRNVAFSVGALAAVAFTAFTIVGFYSLFYGLFPFAMEIDQSFIAAILTVIGYQINDTVVVFDRVRENVGRYPKQDFFTTINKSINSTLGRTVMTSVSTLLVLLCIFILGGDAIRSFVFAMICGVIIGTLCTIFVAAPVAYLIDRKKSKKAVKA